MEKLTWRRVDDEWPDVAEPHGYTYRAEVPGGWLVTVWAGSENYQPHGGGVAFVPDPNHDWAASGTGGAQRKLRRA